MGNPVNFIVVCFVVIIESVSFLFLFILEVKKQQEKKIQVLNISRALRGVKLAFSSLPFLKI